MFEEHKMQAEYNSKSLDDSREQLQAEIQSSLATSKNNILENPRKQWILQKTIKIINKRKEVKV